LTQLSLPSDLRRNPDGEVFYVAGNVDIPGGLNITMQGRKTFIINGYLRINSPMTFDPNASVGFIVRGGFIDIGSNVRNLDGFYYSPIGFTGIRILGNTNPITFHGLLVARNIVIQRTTGVISFDPRIFTKHPPGFSLFASPAWREKAP
jgi:hypothetical protein